MQFINKLNYIIDWLDFSSQIYENNSEFDNKVKSKTNNNQPYLINNLPWQVCNQIKCLHHYYFNVKFWIKGLGLQRLEDRKLI